MDLLRLLELLANSQSHQDKLSFEEFFTHVEPVFVRAEFHGLPCDFTYRFGARVFDAKLFAVRKTLAFAIATQSAFPGNIVLVNDGVVGKYLVKRFSVSRINASRQHRELLSTDPDVKRQLGRLGAFGLVVLGKTQTLAGRLFDAASYRADSLFEYTAALSSLVYYSSKLLGAKVLTIAKVNGMQKCPYCKEPVVGTEDIQCERCGSQHHETCWRENSGCAVFGCTDKDGT